MNSTRRTLIIGNTIVFLAVIAFLIISKLSMDAGIKCILAERAFLYCPGCGGTRSLYALLHLDILSAMRYNIALPFAVFVYIYYNIKAIISIAKKRDDFFKREKFILVYVFIGVLLLNFLVRNILLWGFGIDFIGDILPLK